MNKQLTNQEVLNLWALQTQRSGGNKKLYFRGSRIYNSKKVQLARIINNETAFVNCVPRPVYIPGIVEAISTNRKIFYVPNLANHLENVKYYKRKIKQTLKKIHSPRLTVGGVAHLHNLNKDVTILFEYIQKMKISPDSEITEWLQKIENNYLIEKEVLEKIEKGQPKDGTTPSKNLASFHLELLNKIKKD